MKNVLDWLNLAASGVRMVADIVKGSIQARRLDKLKRIKPIGAENRKHEAEVKRRAGKQ